MTIQSIKNVSAAISILLALSITTAIAAPDKELLYVGSGHKNITAFWLDMASGALTPIGEVGRVDAPSFLTISPTKCLYAVTEGHDQQTSFINAFQIDADFGKLTPINRQPSGGGGPCHVSLSHNLNGTPTDVLVANYGGGSVSVFQLNMTGGLGPMSAFIQDHGSSVNLDRQAGPHAHCIITDAKDRYAFVCDLGLDKILVFKFDASAGSLTPNDPPFASIKPGSGPRHIVFHPNGRFAYLINEMAATVDVFSYDADHGVLTQIQELPTLPADFKGKNTAAEIVVHPSGKFVYTSNRGENAIVVFACDPDTGRLTYVERDSTQGKIPRNFEIDPTGTYLLAANQSGPIVVFRIDPKTGGLTPTGNTVESDLPMCIKFLPLR